MLQMTGWSNLSFRYAVVSLVAAILPLLVVGGAYDRYATNLLDMLTGERLDRRLAAVSSRMSGFFDARFNQLNTLVHYPELGPMIERAATTGRLPDEMRGVLEYEADNPDLYGILVFDAEGRMIFAFPSQSASGPPYWGGGGLPLAEAPQVAVGEAEIVGPIGPDPDRPGSLVIRQRIVSRDGPERPLGMVGLHVRLASVTEFLGLIDTDELMQVLLVAPGGQAYSTVGVAGSAPANLVLGPAVLPGWTPAIAVEFDRLAEPLSQVRTGLAAAMIVLAAGIVSMFALLWIRLSKRLGQLVEGSQELASGHLDTRLRLQGRDEISALAAVFNAMAERLQAVMHQRLEAEKMAALGRFSTNIAHEIRNPLATLKTSVEALIPGESQPERREILAGIDDEIDRLDESLQGILDYARPREPKPRAMPAGTVLRRFEILAAAALKERGVRLVCSGDTSLALYADPAHVQQILTNLVLNAAEAMPGGGTLTVRSLRSGERAALEIADTGTGMAPELLGQVVEPFFTTRPDGTGLGLTITRQLVELNAGRMTIVSEPGSGTTVTVHFPLAPEPAP